MEAAKKKEVPSYEKFTAEVTQRLLKTYGSFGSVPDAELAIYGKKKSKGDLRGWQIHDLDKPSVSQLKAGEEPEDPPSNVTASPIPPRNDTDAPWSLMECLDYLRKHIDYVGGHAELREMGVNTSVLAGRAWQDPQIGAVPSRKAVDAFINALRKEYRLFAGEKIPAYAGPFPAHLDEDAELPEFILWPWVKEQMELNLHPFLIMIPLIAANPVGLPITPKQQQHLPSFEHRVAALFCASRLGWEASTTEVELVTDSHNGLHGLSFNGHYACLHPAEEATCRI